MTATTPSTPPTTRAPARWRTVDIIVAAVLAVAFGIVFAGWDALWNVTGPAFTAFPPLQGVMYGVWLVPGVLGGLVVRKPGAAVFTELLAAVVSVFFGGGGWGLSVVVYGLLEGLAPELVFAATRYGRYGGWRLPVAVVAGALAGLTAAALDIVFYYPTWAATWMVGYAALVMASSALLAGFGSHALVRGLARTGVLAPFASGRGGPQV